MPASWMWLRVEEEDGSARRFKVALGAYRVKPADHRPAVQLTSFRSHPSITVDRDSS